jgi:transposase-like protein
MMTEMRMRRSYTEEFKRDAVTLVTEQGYKDAETARNNQATVTADAK